MPDAPYSHPVKGDNPTPEVVDKQFGLTQTESLQRTSRLETNLFDMASQALVERSRFTGESTDSNHVYLELNRIMGLNNYEPAKLNGRLHISDKDLPSSWNNVQRHQEFKLYPISIDAKAESDALASLRDRLRRQIIEETSTVPVQLGEGYYQVLERMHPEKSPPELTAEAHRIKVINGNRDVLVVGERLATASEEERNRELERRFSKCARDQANCPLPIPRSNPGAEKPSDNGQGQPEIPDDSSPKPPAGEGPRPRPPATPGQPPAGASDPPQVGAGDKPPARRSPPGSNSPVEPPSVPPSSSGPDLKSAYLVLQRQHSDAERSLQDHENGQGIIGRTFDYAKNTIGASADGRSWYDPRRLWSGIFDSDLGSKAVNQKLDAEKAKLDELKLAADAKDVGRFSTLYKEITGKEFDVTGKTGAEAAGIALAQDYDRSQHGGVDAITDIAVAVAVAATLRSGKMGMAQTLAKGMGTGAIVGGVSKSALMQIDGRYANLSHDLSVGALMGATVPIGELGGAQLSKFVGKRAGLTVTGDLLTARIETQGSSLGVKFLSAAAKSGVSGSIFGAIESPGQVAINDLESGAQIHVGDLATASLKGMVMGFVGGTALGFTADSITNGFRSIRPGAVVPFKPKINGVELPASGGISLEEAAKVLNTNPDAFAREAAERPFSAVSKAVKLYEETGLNIKKADALTGQALLPAPFDDALTTVQNVDQLTPNALVTLSGKVKVVEVTDKFLQSNPAVLDESLNRILAEPNYKDVVRLKIAHQGQDAADAFETKFRQSFTQDLKTRMSVEQVNTKGLQPEGALKKTQPDVEAAYKQKAADYFKDMTDPAQRARLNELVEDIYKKFNPESLSKADIESVLSTVADSDRQLAIALLHESAGTSSDVLLRTRLQVLKNDISAMVGTSSPGDVYSLAPDSSANLLGYLYRKSNSMSMSMQNIDKLESAIKHGYTPNTVVLFDDLSSTPISQSNLALLKTVPHVYVVDIGAFEKAVNIIDVAKGPQAVALKLDHLLTHAKAVRAANPGMLDSGVAKLALQSEVDEAVKAIGPNAKVIRPSGNIQTPNASTSAELAGMSDVDAIHSQYNIDKASRDQIAGFLSGYVGEERELAARMLAEGAVHNSFPVMVKKAISLHDQLAKSLFKSGLAMKDLLIVSDKDPGGSTHLVSYLFGKANGLHSENFISSQKLDKLVSSGLAKDKAVAYFDDTIYSGAQTTGLLNTNISSLMPFKKVVIGSLGAYEKGIKSIRGTHLASLGKVEVASSTMHQPFYSESHPFFRELGSTQQYTVKNIGGSEGFGSVQGSLIWSYMYPDNNLSFFGAKFSGGILRLPGP